MTSRNLTVRTPSTDWEQFIESSEYNAHNAQLYRYKKKFTDKLQ